MIIEKYENGIYKMLDLSELPKKRWNGKTTIDWLAINNHKINFIWGDTRGEFILIEPVGKPSDKRILVKHKKYECIMSYNSIRQGGFSRLLKQHGKYLYKEGEVINNNIKILKKVKDSKKKGLWYEVECVFSKNTWLASQDNLKRGSQSPYKNWLYSEKHILPFLKDKNEAKRFSSFSSKKITVSCPSCKKERKVIIANLVKQGFSCPVCSSKTSFPEKVVAEFLQKNKVNFQSQKRFKGASYFYDFYLPDNNTIIEVHGAQHYKNSSGFLHNRLKDIQKNDRDKRQWALNNGIDYVVVDARYSTYNYIFKSIENLNIFPRLTNNDKKQIKIKIEANKNHNTDSIIKDYKKGVPLKIIEEKYGLTNGELIGITKRLGVYSPRNTRPQKVQVVDIHSKVVFPSVAKSALFYNISEAGVRQRCVKRKSSMYYEDYIEKYGTEGLTEYVEEPEKQIN